MTDNIEQLIHEGAGLKATIDSANIRLKEIALILDGAAAFAEDSKTGHLVGGGYKVKVTRRENVKWNQVNLERMKGYFKNSFDRIFKTEYKPQSTKKLTEAMIANPEFAKAVAWAREVKPGSPGITFESITEGN